LEWIADDEPDLTWSGKTFFIRASGRQLRIDERSSRAPLKKLKEHLKMHEYHKSTKHP